MLARALPIALAASAVVVVACSSSNTSSSSSSSSFCCQINGAAWDCPDQTSLQKCSDVKNPDPSACKTRSTLCNGSPASGSSSGTTSGSSTSSSSSSSSTSSSSGSSGCSLFTCTNTQGCGGIAPCMSTSTGTSYCYEQEGSPSQCSQGTTPTTAIVDGSSRTLCVPSGCPQPGTYVP